MRLSFQEIRQRAIQFGHDWKDETSERAEAQTFWNEFFNVFGINRRSVASFERTVRNLQGAYDRIDVIWQGVIIGEHKSKGQDLNRAATQALGYVQSLTHAGRDAEIPRFIAVSDFSRIVLHDLESTDPLFESVSFPVEELHEHIRLFDFLNGIQLRPPEPEDPINIKAVEVLGELHDTLEKGGYSGHQLERLLVRVLFCLFADDTGIFEPDTFKSFIEETREDGSDLGTQLHALFKALDQPEDKRPARMPETFRQLPYVNGQLFREDLDLAYFDRDMRKALLKACSFQWAKISPAVFGSLFQSIMAGEGGAKKRRQIGAHYTSERDIMKLIRSLFLDDLRAEFERVKARRSELVKFHEKLGILRFLDPACGCGNFLVVGYRELRRLEHEVIETLFPDHGLLEIVGAVRLDVDCMHGIEIEEWPARIAEVAMWLIDHQMNLEASQKFGKPLMRLPLKKSAKIEHANALRMDWNSLLPANRCSFVMGNPPFVGKKERTKAQKADIDEVTRTVKGSGVLDYVACWYLVAAEYIRKAPTRCAFVSTNSITQGEQVGVLWPELFRRQIKIYFGHRTFRWMSEARGKAHVHVVIIGFGVGNRGGKIIYDYGDVEGDPVAIPVDNINPYLVAGADFACVSRSKPICAVPEIMEGSALIDNGHLLIEDEMVEDFRAKNPEAAKWVRPFSGGDDLINGKRRWCLWLDGVSPNELRLSPGVMERISAVRAFRMASGRGATVELAQSPALFGEIRQPKGRYLFIPKTSSERRTVLPMAFVSAEVIINNTSLFIEDASEYHFGILVSKMHMAWIRQVCGRLESRYRYSNKLVYNNFPWPQDVGGRRRSDVESAARTVLSARDLFPGQTLADLYDPLATPKALLDAHKKLDAAVDKCYRPAPFVSERNRVEYLFELYQRLIAPLTTPTKKSGKQRKQPAEKN